MTSRLCFLLCISTSVANGVLQAQYRNPTKASKREPLQIALTFDDLPAHGPLPPDVSRLQIAQSILATLKQEELPPVYGFINAEKVQQDPSSLEVLKAWRASGEPLGSHTWSHPALDEMSANDFEVDIAKNEQLLDQLAGGTDWHYFRYPYLQEGDTAEKHEEVQKYLKQHQYKTAEVTLDFEDYLWNAPYARCIAKHDEARIGALHDSYLAIAEEYISLYRSIALRLYGREIPYVMLLHIGAFDAKMLPDLIAMLREHGFKFVTLQQAESDPVYSQIPNIGYKGGGALQELEGVKRKMVFPPNAKPNERLEKLCADTPAK